MHLMAVGRGRTADVVVGCRRAQLRHTVVLYHVVITVACSELLSLRLYVVERHDVLTSTTSCHRHDPNLFQIRDTRGQPL
jgi:hypothetical protein